MRQVLYRHCEAKLPELTYSWQRVLFVREHSVGLRLAIGMGQGHFLPDPVTTQHGGTLSPTAQTLASALGFAFGLFAPCGLEGGDDLETGLLMAAYKNLPVFFLRGVRDATRGILCFAHDDSPPLANTFFHCGSGSESREKQPRLPYQRQGPPKRGRFDGGQDTASKAGARPRPDHAELGVPRLGSGKARAGAAGPIQRSPVGGADDRSE